MRSLMRKKLFSIFLITCVLIEPILARRGGGSSSRGSSAGRSHGMGGSRSRGNSGGGYHNSGSSYPRGNYGVGPNNRQSSGGIFGGNNRQNTGSGGIFGGSNRQNSGGGWFGGNRQSNTPRFNKGSGVGSVLRSNTFKNAIVGAAAGYLLYQGGKHLIRSAMAPMMWGGRPYYWGSNYYQPRPGNQMCRMPVSPSDPQFGNIYFQDNSRPKEIVWGCGYNEVCCGYECCPSYGGGMNPGYGSGGYNSGYAPGYYNSAYRSVGFGSLLILLLLSCCACFIAYRLCNRSSNTYQRANAY